jgi:hypothetical protein
MSIIFKSLNPSINSTDALLLIIERKDNIFINIRRIINAEYFLLRICFLATFKI